MENKKEVNLDLHTIGKLVFAIKQNTTKPQEWVILIHSTGVGDRYNINSFKVKSHVSYCFTTGTTFVNEGTPGWWGYSDNYRFYEPTEEQREKILGILKSKKLKFIPILNKLIRIKHLKQ